MGEWALGWLVCTPFNELFIISRNWLALGGAALLGQMSKHRNTEYKSRGECRGAGGGRQCSGRVGDRKHAGIGRREPRVLH